MQESISRRGFLARTGPVVAALVPSAALLEGSAFGRRRRRRRRRDKKKYFVLQPEWSTSARCNVRENKKPDDCHACKACHKHAKNKMFATRRAANRHRAHKHCKCKIVKGGKLKNEVWSDLFGGLENPRRRTVDRRDRRVRRILRRAAAAR